MAAAAAPPIARPEPQIPAHLHPATTPARVRRAKRASFARAKFWGLILSVLTDAVTTDPGAGQPLVPLGRTPKLPDGPLIVVANHASHLDTVVLAATLGRSRPVRFVAAADYWLESRLYLWAAMLLASIWPIRRSRTGRDDLLAAASTIEAGVVFIVFPEGTRRQSEKMAGFKRGAFELAIAAGARILPVGIVGTSDVLPKRANRPRRGPIEIRWGAPLTVDDVDRAATDARTTIGALIEKPAVVHAGAGWARVRRIAFSVTGLAVIGGWAFAEGISWPLIAEMPLLLLVITVGRSWRGPLLIAVSALASALGILTTWWLVSHGLDTPTPLTTDRMHAVALEQLNHDPGTAFWNQMWNGIPVKVYAHGTGVLGMSFVDVLATLLPRVLRIAIVGGAGWLLGGVLARWLKPCLGMVQLTCLAWFPVCLAVIIWLWS